MKYKKKDYKDCQSFEDWYYYYENASKEELKARIETLSKRHKTPRKYEEYRACIYLLDNFK